jgi:hypothetical protein
MMSALCFHRGFYYTCSRPLGRPPRVSYSRARIGIPLQAEGALGRSFPCSFFLVYMPIRGVKEIRANRVREIRNRRGATVFLLWIFDVASLSTETETTYMIPMKPRQLWPL